MTNRNGTLICADAKSIVGVLGTLASRRGEQPTLDVPDREGRLSAEPRTSTPGRVRLRLGGE